MCTMMHSVADWRNRRTHFAPKYPVANYYTDAPKEMNGFGEDLFHSLHLIPEPLKKNLADTLVTNQDFKQPKEEANMSMPPNMPSDQSPLSGIANFFSGMLSALSGAMFRRSRSPPSANGWQQAKTEYKNGFASPSAANVAMSECKTVADACEDKLSQVRELLANKSPRYRPRKPRRVFVEPVYIEEHFEDAFSPEDFVRLANDTIIEYFSPLQYQQEEYVQVDTPTMRLEVAPVFDEHTSVPEVKEIVPNEVKEESPAVVASCEDKLSKLKALLQNKCNATKEVVTTSDVIVPTKPTKAIPIKTRDKRYKNPHRSTDKRQKTKMKQSIQEDLLFANEINLDEVSSVENSPSFHSLEKVPDTPSYDTPQEFFDEVSGRFRTASASSEDSYQIVFSDIPKRVRSTSECDSEDSFIVFEDSPDSCYTSNDVFGDSSDCSDSESDVSDSGCDNMRLTQSLSRTVSNLTDDSLYDEVDCARTLQVCDSEKSTGLLIDDRKKALKKNLPPKKVRFSAEAPRVRVMRVWSYAARQARIGNWHQCSLDRDRFKRRIADVDMAVSWVLKPQHRARIMFQRFMPWWNAQKRLELAEKKQKEEAKKAEALQTETHTEPEVSQSGEVLQSNRSDADIENTQIDVPNLNLDKDLVECSNNLVPKNGLRYNADDLNCEVLKSKSLSIADSYDANLKSIDSVNTCESPKASELETVLSI